MKTWRPFLIGVIGLMLATLLIYFGEMKPPSTAFVLGLFVGACSLFYIMIICTIRFTVYLLRELGYAEKDNSSG